MIRAKMDHDLRSHLNVVLGYSAMLKEELPAFGAADAVKDVDCIASAGYELLHLSSQVEDLTRLGSDAWQSRSAEVILEDVLAQVIDTLAERNLHCPIEVEGSAVLAAGDETLILRLFNGLLSLMCKMIPPQAAITLHLGESNPGVVVTCSLTGLDDTEKSRLQNQIVRLTTPVQHMSDIKDFDGYYLTTLSHFANAKMLAASDQTTFRMELFPECSTAVDKNTLT